MKKSTRIIIVAICIFVVALTFFLINDMEKKLAERTSNSNIQEKNENLVNVANEIKNEVTNTNTSTNKSNNVINTTNTTQSENVVQNNNSIEENNNIEKEVIQESSMEDEINKEVNSETAIELVKKKWGEADTSVYYTSEGINDNGEYLVAVRSKESTFIMANFKVNVSTKEVKIDL